MQVSDAQIMIGRQGKELDLIDSSLKMFVANLQVTSPLFTINASASEIRMDFRNWKFLARPRVVAQEDHLAYELCFSSIVGLKLAVMGSLFVLKDGRITYASASAIKAGGANFWDYEPFCDTADETCANKLFEFLWRAFFKSDLVKP
jgi:hypothetical protein